MIILERYLDNLESSLLGRAPSLVAEYHGRLHEKALAQALDVLCTQYPVLRATIQTDHKGQLLSVEDGCHPRLAVVEGGIGELHREANRPWDPSRSVIRLLLVHGSGMGFVALRVDHSIADAASITSFFSSLWRNYTKIVENRNVVTEFCADLPVAPTVLIPDKKIEISHESKDYVAAGERIGPYVEKHVQLSHEETMEIKEKANESKITIHGLVCGAALVTLRKFDHVTKGATPMLCQTIVDLRKRSDPAIEETATTNLLGLHSAEILVSASDSMTVVGGVLCNQLYEDLSFGKVPIYGRMNAQKMTVSTSVSRRLSTLIVSNGGVFPELDHPSDVEITNFDVIVTERDVGAIPISAVVFTYSGRLTLKMYFPSVSFTDEEMDLLALRTVSQLKHS